MNFSLLALNLCVICTYFAIHIEAEKNIEIITDLVRVETLTKEYLQERKSPIRRGRSYIARAIGHKSILDRDDEVKEAFCRFIIQPQENGFKLDQYEYRGPSIKTRKFKLSYRPLMRVSNQPTRELDIESMQESGDQPISGAQEPSTQETTPLLSAYDAGEQSGVESSQLLAEIPDEPVEESDLELPMYPCPQILYFDLDENNEVVFPFIFLVSKGKKYDSAIVFLQEGQTSTPYPMEYVKNISFSQLTEKYGDYTEVSFRPPSPDLSGVYTKEIELTTIGYLSTRRMNLVYEKFRNLYHSVNICAQRRLVKIQFCRLAMSNFAFSTKVDTHGYDEDVCRKVQIHFAGEVGHTYNPTRSVYVLQCPPVISFMLSRRHKYTLLYYLSSTLQQNSAILFMKKNTKGEHIEPVNVEKNLDPQFVRRETARASFIPYRRDKLTWPVYRKEYIEIGSRLGAVDFITVQMPVTLARAEAIQFRPKLHPANPLRVSVNRWLTEDVLIEFSKVKKTTLSKYSGTNHPNTFNYRRPESEIWPVEPFTRDVTTPKYRHHHHHFWFQIFLSVDVQTDAHVWIMQKRKPAT